MSFTAIRASQPDGFEPEDEDEKQKALHTLFGCLTAEQMVSDGKAYIDFLLAQKGVKPGKVGVVGYCFTGQMALRMAAAVPDKVAAAASFHGGFLVTDKPDSPHKQLPPSEGAALFRPCGGRCHRHAGTDRDAGRGAARLAWRLPERGL